MKIIESTNLLIEKYSCIKPADKQPVTENCMLKVLC